MDYLSFEARIVPMMWGDSTYTVLPLPAEVDQTLRAAGAKRVEGEINDYPVNLALTTAPVMDDTFLWTGKTLLDRIGIGPGDAVEVRLRPADPDAVDVPDYVQAALLSGGALSAWDALTPGRQRGHLHGIATAKRDDTRARRVAALVKTLTDPDT